MCNEHDAYKVIGHIPVFNFFYSGIRAAVYAGQGNIVEANRSGIGMIPFAHSAREAAPVVGDVVLTKAKEYAVEAVMKGGKGVVAAIVSFCAANSWLVGGAVVVIVVTVAVFVMWRKAQGRAEEARENEKIRMAVETALENVMDRLREPMMGKESLNAMIDEQIRGEQMRGEL